MDQVPPQPTISPTPPVPPLSRTKTITFVTILIGILLLLFIAPIPYYQSEEVSCKLGQTNCPRIGWLWNKPLYQSFMSYIQYSSRSQNSRVDTPTPTATADPTANWKTYVRKDFSLKYPMDIDVLTENNSIVKFGNPIFKTVILSVYFTNLTSIPKDAESVIVDGKQAKKFLKVGEYLAVQTTEKPLMEIRYASGLGNSKETDQSLFDQILSTFKFLDRPSPTTSTQINGADLKNIKYKLSQGWEAKLNNDSLFISPVNGGGYLSIRVYDYPGNVGRREYYCQVSKVCIEGTSYFTEMNIGNISGYIANALDNSGGGPEYFGAKGSKFYIISSYNPPSPNEFEQNYKSVLNSLVF